MLRFDVSGAPQNSLSQAIEMRNTISGGFNAGTSGQSIVENAGTSGMGELERFTNQLNQGLSWEQVRRQGNLPFLPNVETLDLVIEDPYIWSEEELRVLGQLQ